MSSQHRNRPVETVSTLDLRWERACTVVLGGTLVALGLKRRSLVGTVVALVGGWLLYRGVGGDGRLLKRSEATGTEGRNRTDSEAGPSTVERSVTIGRSAEELSEFLRDPENLESVVNPFAEVTTTGDDRHRWTVRGPLNRRLSWEARIVEDRPGELLRWEAVDGSPLYDEWSVGFRPAPDDRGTEVTLRYRFDPPGGQFGRAAARSLEAVPEAVLGTALDRFKSLVETGEIPTTERNPSARGAGDLL